MDVTDGVYTLPVSTEIEDDTITINPGAIETERGLLLVDSGWPGAAEEMAEGLAEAGFDWDDVWGVVLTHQDVDHAGGLAEIRDLADPVTFAHPTCAPYVDGREHPVKMDDGRYPPARIDVEVTEGTTFDTSVGPAEVLFTPGHAPGHVSLYLRERRLLFSGDALHAPEGDVDGPRYPRDEETAIESVEKLGELDVETTITQHGGVVEHGAGAIEAIDPEAGD